MSEQTRFESPEDYRAYAEHVARKACRSAPKETLEDAVQEALIRLVVNWERLDHSVPHKVKAWVRLAVRHRIMEATARNTYYMRKASPACLGAESSDEDRLLEHASAVDHRPAIHGLLWAERAIDAMRGALPPSQFKAFTCYLDGCSDKEAARALGTTPAGYRAKLSRARAAARRLFAEAAL